MSITVDAVCLLSEDPVSPLKLGPLVAFVPWHRSDGVWVLSKLLATFSLTLLIL